LRLIAGQPLRQSFNPEFYTGYLASGAIIFVLVLATSRIVAARGLSTAFPAEGRLAIRTPTFTQNFCPRLSAW
jgi:hypothetical protein